jgi:SMC interacting uncharacterized protein involved in chromosome segregation
MKTINFVKSLFLLIFMIAVTNPYAQATDGYEENVFGNLENKKLTEDHKIKLRQLKIEIAELKREYITKQKELRSELKDLMLKDSLSYENFEKRNSEVSKIYMKYANKVVDYLYELKTVR